ncbi:hypothetical protein NPIL_666221 [Nephila pilipes]|uniref:Uncharacterized protein n=1 Tax=Nephila pilipes TaxID=299642 RepID=A0A8X6NAI9_NEPPI|nr:hypothetical protein NPIL_666221 [Nephila pilipes]
MKCNNEQLKETPKRSNHQFLKALRQQNRRPLVHRSESPAEHLTDDRERASHLPLSESQRRCSAGETTSQAPKQMRSVFGMEEEIVVAQRPTISSTPPPSDPFPAGSSNDISYVRTIGGGGGM